MSEQPYLLTAHDENGKERTYSFPTLAARDAFIERLKERTDIDTGPLIPDDKFNDYMARRDAMLDSDGVFVDVWDNKAKFSMSEEAHVKIAAEAEAAGLDVQTYLQRSIDETAGKMFPQAGLTRQQRRHRERQARKKSKSIKG